MKPKKHVGSQAAIVSGIVWCVSMVAVPGNAQTVAGGSVDFAIESLAFNPPQLYVNTVPRLTVKVKNVGHEPVDEAQIFVSFSNRRTDGASAPVPGFDSATFNKPYANPRIAAGEVVSLDASLHNAMTLPPGSYEVKATLSLGGSARGKDANPANDAATLTYQVAAGREPGTNGDLTITGYRLNDNGSYHELIVQLANLGTDPLLCNYDVVLDAKMMGGTRRVFTDHQVVYPHKTPFAPGAKKQIVFKVVDADTKQRLANGTYQLSLDAWAQANSCPETNADNNGLAAKVVIGPTLAPKPPLTPAPHPAKPGPEVRIPPS